MLSLGFHRFFFGFPFGSPEASGSCVAKAMAESSLSDFALPGGVGAGLGDGLMRLNLWHSLILFRLV